MFDFLNLRPCWDKICLLIYCLSTIDFSVDIYKMERNTNKVTTKCKVINIICKEKTNNYFT